MKHSFPRKNTVIIRKVLRITRARLAQRHANSPVFLNSRPVGYWARSNCATFEELKISRSAQNLTWVIMLMRELIVCNSWCYYLPREYRSVISSTNMRPVVSQFISAYVFIVVFIHTQSTFENQMLFVLANYPPTSTQILDALETSVKPFSSRHQIFIKQPQESLRASGYTPACAEPHSFMSSEKIRSRCT
jgi:hypothetical protein